MQPEVGNKRDESVVEVVVRVVRDPTVLLVRPANKEKRSWDLQQIVSEVLTGLGRHSYLTHQLIPV